MIRMLAGTTDTDPADDRSRAAALQLIPAVAVVSKATGEVVLEVAGDPAAAVALVFPDKDVGTLGRLYEGELVAASVVPRNASEPEPPRWVRRQQPRSRKKKRCGERAVSSLTTYETGPGGFEAHARSPPFLGGSEFQ
ncbi:hypothetical protein ABZ307_35000 [Streptomyces griseorubiginosus]|uniref:hypothetical protein n=1 Tax=Streptomyces griseorubiginosus TaxID=67304 RepID=UPI0033BD0ECA